MIFFPVLVGILGVLVSYIFSANLSFSINEGLKIAKVMWAVMAVGAFIYIFT
jgi:uncharacterized membrane protein YeaQ/YmgE (transglycosylase-associated protein family)